MNPDLVHTQRLRALDFWQGPITAEPIPGGTVTARPAAHRVRVARKWSPAAEIVAFRLETIGTGLPDFEAVLDLSDRRRTALPGPG